MTYCTSCFSIIATSCLFIQYTVDLQGHSCFILIEIIFLSLWARSISLSKSQTLKATNQSEKHYCILLPAASHYCTDYLPFSFPRDDRHPHPFRAFYTKNSSALRRSTPICAHLRQPINRSVKLNHLVSACDYGIYRWGSSLTFARPPTLYPPRLAVSPLYCRRRRRRRLIENQSFSHTPHPFPTCEMTHQPASDRFQALLYSALQEYEKRPGVTLAGSEDSLAIQLQRCHSIDAITTLLQDKTQAFDDFQQRDRIFKSIKATVSILAPISALASAADGASLVRQKVLRACLAFLTVFKGITPTCESDKFYSRYRTARMYHSSFHT